MVTDGWTAGWLCRRGCFHANHQSRYICVDAEDEHEADRRIL